MFYVLRSQSGLDKNPKQEIIISNIDGESQSWLTFHLTESEAYEFGFNYLVDQIKVCLEGFEDDERCNCENLIPENERLFFYKWRKFLASDESKAPTLERMKEFYEDSCEFFEYLWIRVRVGECKI